MAVLGARTGGGAYMTFVPNVAGIEAAGRIAGTVGVELVAHRALEVAKRIAPVLTGAYRDSIYIEVGDARAIIASDIRYAIYLELGTSDTPRFATLRTAVEQAQI